MTEPSSPPLGYKPPDDMKARLKASYDAIAPRYNDWTVPHSTTRLQRLDQLLSRLSRSPATSVSILELGCGCGIPVTEKLLTYPNISVIANDLSSAQIALARASLVTNACSPARDRLNLVEGDMLGLDIKPSTLDAVIAMYSIIHLPREEQVEMLRKIVAWLKPGGLFLANFGAEASTGCEMTNWLKEEKGWMFWSGWGSEATLEKVQEAGLEIIVEDVVEDVVDANFLWILAKKGDL